MNKLNMNMWQWLKKGFHIKPKPGKEKEEVIHHIRGKILSYRRSKNDIMF